MVSNVVSWGSASYVAYVADNAGAKSLFLDIVGKCSSASPVILVTAGLDPHYAPALFLSADGSAIYCVYLTLAGAVMSVCYSADGCGHPIVATPPH
jgi:hypothetical protein